MKRACDLVLATLSLVVMAPLMAVVALMIRAKLGGPVMFTQTRPGLHGVPFELLKFRTMTTQCDDAGQLLPDAERLTAFGAALRRTSLDELPQLINVLKGEMSLVGPRPLLMEYIPLYTPRQALRLAVKPGVTGWAQVNGRNAVEWEQKFELDAWYVEHQSLALDLRILWMTVANVILGRGVTQPGHVTAERFRGTSR